MTIIISFYLELTLQSFFIIAKSQVMLTFLLNPTQTRLKNILEFHSISKFISGLHWVAIKPIIFNSTASKITYNKTVEL